MTSILEKATKKRKFTPNVEMWKEKTFRLQQIMLTEHTHPNPLIYDALSQEMHRWGGGSDGGGEEEKRHDNVEFGMCKENHNVNLAIL